MNSHAEKLAAAAQVPSLMGPSSVSRERIRLIGPEATAIPMVYAKSVDATHQKPILGDLYAQAILDRIDLKDFAKQLGGMAPDQRHIDYLVGRSKRYDEWCQAFINSHGNEHITVLHLACGLDCRVLRVKRHEKVRWIDVDQPLVVDLRTRIIDTQEVPGDYTLRTLQLTKKGWLADLPSDQPTLVIAEGLFMYLKQAEGQQVFRDIVGYFGSGQVIFDTVGSLCVKATTLAKVLRPSGASWTWGVDDVKKDIVQLDSRLKHLESVFWWQLGKRHPPMWGEFLTSAICLHPKSRTTLALHRLGF